MRKQKTRVRKRKGSSNQLTHKSKNEDEINAERTKFKSEVFINNSSR